MKLFGLIAIKIGGYLHIFGSRLIVTIQTRGLFANAQEPGGRRQSRRRRLPPLSHGQASRALKCRIHTGRVWQRQDLEIERQRGVGRKSSRHRLAGGCHRPGNCARRQLGSSTPRRGGIQVGGARFLLLRLGCCLVGKHRFDGSRAVGCRFTHLQASGIHPYILLLRSFQA